MQKTAKKFKMEIEYIYDPEQIKDILQNCEFKDKLDDPEKGSKSINFPKARKSPREIYRILCNLDYPHIKTLLDDLNLCWRNSWQPPKLLKTKSKSEFHSFAVELSVAAHFAKLGLKISCPEKQKGQERVPDILVEGEGISCLCEVYAPRVWEGLECFIDDLRFSILHLDTPWDFNCETRMSLLNEFDQNGNLVLFDPRQFSIAYEHPQSRAEKIKPLLNDVVTRLQQSDGKNFPLKLLDEPLNIVTEIAFDRIQKSQGVIPSRNYNYSYSYTSPREEFMFDKIVRNRILSKIGKKQTFAGFGAYLSALFVHIPSFFCPINDGSNKLEAFIEIIRRHLDSKDLKIDMVVFFFPNSSRYTGIEIPLFKRKKDNVSDKNVEVLLGEDTASFLLSQ